MSRIYADNLQLREPGYRFAKPSSKNRRRARIGAATVPFLLVAVAAASYQPTLMQHVSPPATSSIQESSVVQLRAKDMRSSAATTKVADIVPTESMPWPLEEPDDPVAPTAEPALVTQGSENAVNANPPTVRQLFGLGIRTIVIDAGHGGNDPGAVGPTTGIQEKDVTLDIARRLQERLERTGSYRVLLVRNSDRFLALKERATYANAQETDLFVSIHVNYIAGTSFNAIETYYFGHDQDARARALAQRENAHSAYSIAEFEHLFKTLRDSVKLEESMRLAGAIQASLLRKLRQQNPSVLDTGVKTAPFVVLMGVKAPSVLAEIGNLGNPETERNLGKPAYRDAISAYLANGITDYLNHQLQEAEVHHVKVEGGTAKQ